MSTNRRALAHHPDVVQAGEQAYAQALEAGEDLDAANQARIDASIAKVDELLAPNEEPEEPVDG